MEIKKWPVREVMKYLAYDKIEPIENPWLQAGIVASTVHNVQCTNRSQMKSANDFIPKRDKKPLPISLQKQMFEKRFMKLKT